MNKDQIDERFLVRGRMEILCLLNDLIHRYEAITVSASDGAGAFVTRLLEARDQVLIFEAAGDGAADLPLLQGASCEVMARPDGILVQFSGENVQRVAWGGSEALCMPLPQSIVRLQRQESLRIRIPAAAGLMVQLFADGGASLGAWPLHDLSVGGLGIDIGDGSRLAGQNIVRVMLELPDLGALDCAVTVRHTSLLADSASQPSGRIGLGFCDLPVAARATIQRYILNTAQARRSLTSEADAGDRDEI